VTEKQQERVFEQWLEQHRGLVFKIVRAYAATAMDRDDLFQEISIQLWNSIPSFKGECSVTTWLYRISLNTSLKWIKKERTRAGTKGMMVSAAYILQENNKETNERLEWLYEQISRLDEIDRSIALLLLEDFSYKEMSDILGISESNVGVKINRIKKNLMSKLRKEYRYGI
jgi:RNA polymerase sigma-70 factor (ECF subfamily)